MNKLLFVLTMTVALVFPVQVFSQVEGVDYQWKKTLEKKGIQVFSSKVPNSNFRAVRAQMLVKGDVKSLVALLEDRENCSSWASLCKDLSLLKKIDRDEYFVYVLNAAIFPIARRDIVAKITWFRDTETGRLTMDGQAVKDFQNMPKKTGVVRINDARIQWHFTPKGDGYVLVESYVHIDPNGNIPSWIVNYMSRATPFRSMKKVRKIVQSGKYTNTIVNLPEKYL